MSDSQILFKIIDNQYPQFYLYNYINLSVTISQMERVRIRIMLNNLKQNKQNSQDLFHQHHLVDDLLGLNNRKKINLDKQLKNSELYNSFTLDAGQVQENHNPKLHKLNSKQNLPNNSQKHKQNQRKKNFLSHKSHTFSLSKNKVNHQNPQNLEQLGIEKKIISQRSSINTIKNFQTISLSQKNSSQTKRKRIRTHVQSLDFNYSHSFLQKPIKKNQVTKILSARNSWSTRKKIEQYKVNKIVKKKPQLEIGRKRKDSFFQISGWNIRQSNRGMD